MKVGDLVTGKKEGGSYDGSVGIVFGFDEDNDPIVSWCNDWGSNEVSPGSGEFRSSLRVISASR
jgi:hypothetical protein